MRKSVDERIKESIAEGYVYLDESKGDYSELLEKYRAEGYDVRTWYIDRRANVKSFVVYGREKRARRSSKKVVVDFSTLNTKELRELCKKHSIPAYYKMKKDEMVKALSEKGI